MESNYLKVKVRGSIITDIVDIAKYHSINRGINAGWFSVPRQVFCIVDFLGSISYNNKGKESGASTRKAVRFIKEFFPKHYKPFANLLIAMWRHGTVHNFAPSAYYVVKGNRKIIIRWTSNRSDAIHNRKVNLNIFDKKGQKDNIFLSINTCQLADDLLNAFDKFINKIERKPSFMNGCLKRLNRTISVKNYMTLKVGNLEKDELRRQIILAKNSTKGEIDDKLQVKWYNAN
ncbi:MAG: hypothetical protein A2057_06840 [Ignavibacteria bacterium GWA2_35_9]|nr:MAG: hypothetical protein A2057_06840 [Ignavibacteria bacterium GWA2_35_9]OGU46073.1 MAG: hypothetical protein A2000_03770 [Ignavibacteria bacterium GWB2_36_8]OGU51775.1 MAG: hypothetical protein A2080_13605 [Ignavibacteria bacterium GWC2_36_12]OGV01860.1 MAG: hypothetical protein A3J84_07650 [Ignavibacteria bacterium RIFOXYA2_FULL_37_17]OGV04648.1 MAG: hypothetical protein A2330_09655 [Ignavibacteria bacterium RIFOXYB2_FULL_36_7]